MKIRARMSMSADWLRDDSERMAGVDRRPVLRPRPEPWHPEVLEGCEAALMGRATFEPALSSDRWPWPN
jgi:hypothetical protein